MPILENPWRELAWALLMLAVLLLPLCIRRGAMVVWPKRGWLARLAIFGLIVGVAALYGAAGLPGTPLVGLLAIGAVAVIFGRIVMAPGASPSAAPPDSRSTTPAPRATYPEGPGRH